MIVHKHAKDMQPHEGLEYFHKSKEPESVHDCVFMWCWECIFNTPNLPCKKHAEFIKKEREANES
jgi:hypothetical protein